MLHRSFKPAKCKTALKLATSRIKLMKNKKENHLKQLKRELAQLLESGQDQTARIRVEHVVREQKTIAAYDLIDIYCELIVARLPMIDSQKNCPIDLKEAVASVVFATPRCADIPELQDVRKHFTAKYGKEFVNGAIELRPDSGVSRMLVEKLSANAPDGQTKLKILSAIAEEHNVEWDPKSFGEKESKPYDDLLQGPSQMYTEPPIVQAPPPPANVHAPQGRDQNHNAPTNHQQNMHSSSSQDFASSDFSGGQSVPSTVPHPPVRPSGAEHGGTEVRHSQSRDESAFSSQKWNMEFKDATAAAQAAAESAERASMAARAAAELSSGGRIRRQHSNESHMSNTDSVRDDRPRKNYESRPSEKFVKDADYISPHTQTEQVHGYEPESHYDADERFHKDDNSGYKRYSSSASSESKPASVSVGDKRPVNDFHEVDTYYRQNSPKDEAVIQDNIASSSVTKLGKHSSEDNHNNYPHSSSSDDGNDYNNSPSHQNFVFDDSKDPFNNETSPRETVTEAVFDSYLSDNDIIKFDKQPQYDEQESDFYSASIAREPSNKFSVDINHSFSSEKPVPAPRFSPDLFSPPQFDETSPKSPPSASHRDDLAPPAFDDYSVPSSDGEDELEKSSIRSYKENDKNDSVSSIKKNSFYSSDEKEDTEVTIQNKHREEYNSSRSRTKFDYDEAPVSPQSISESVSELKFPTLTGGIRNKGYKIPPYRKSPSGDSLSSKEAAEDIPTYTQSAPTSSRLEPKMKESSNSKTRFENYSLGTDEFEGELPRQNLQSKKEKYATKENSSSKTGIKSYDLGTDDFEEELPKPKLSNKQERKNENYTKSKFSPPAGFFDDDSEEDLPKQTVTSKVRAESKFSRRTKANPDSETSSYSKPNPISETSSYARSNPVSVSRNKPKVSEIRNKPDEKQKVSAVEQPSSPLVTATSSSSAEAPSRESSLTKASHVHPKLPDYDSFAAHFQSLRQNRG